jgi:hypothetical protein
VYSAVVPVTAAAESFPFSVSAMNVGEAYVVRF